MKTKTTLYLLFIATILFAACNPKEDFEPQINEVVEDEVENYTEVSVPNDYVTIEEAREELENFLKDFSTLSKSSGSFSSKKITNAFTLTSTKPSISKSTQTDTTSIHVFNFEDDGGFAIMSATREMPSLLAITEDGNLDTSKVIDNPGLIIFLNGLEMKSAQIRANSVDNKSKIDDNNGGITETFTKTETVGKRLYNPVGGYCKVHWRQDYPFNVLCPIKYEHRTSVGCVAVACAQLMSIYQYPQKYNDTTLHWTEMIANEYHRDIAWLMRRLGDSLNLNMEYNIPDSGGSRAAPSLIPQTLRRFGFSNGGVKSSYSTKKVCADLRQGYPVLIGGNDTKEIDTSKMSFGITYIYSRGHRWLAHGLLEITKKKTTYEMRKNQQPVIKSVEILTFDYVLCNFGWGESERYNGYYLSGVFDAHDGSLLPETYSKSNKVDYYQYQVNAVTGIRK